MILQFPEQKYFPLRLKVLYLSGANTTLDKTINTDRFRQRNVRIANDFMHLFTGGEFTAGLQRQYKNCGFWVLELLHHRGSAVNLVWISSLRCTGSIRRKAIHWAGNRYLGKELHFVYFCELFIYKYVHQRQQTEF